MIEASLSSGLALSGSTASIPAATASVDGYMTKAQASKLAGIASGATAVTESTVSG